MPELPEVETVRRTLNQLIIGKTIERVQVGLQRIIQRPQDPEAFARQLEGQTFSAVERRGKFFVLCWTTACSFPICGWKADTVYMRRTMTWKNIRMCCLRLRMAANCATGMCGNSARCICLNQVRNGRTIR